MQEGSHRDFALHFRTTSFDSCSTPTLTNNSSVTTEDEEELVYTTTTEFILNPTAPTREELIQSSSSSEDEASLPDVSITVETSAGSWVITSENYHSQNMSIVNVDNDLDGDDMT